MRALVLSCGAMLFIGCGSGTNDGDAGTEPLVDAGRDGGKLDGGDDPDAGRSSSDAGVHDAGRSDGGALDSGSRNDAGCVPPVCPAPPEGCSWVGATSCSCGALECPATACGDTDCAPGFTCDHAVGCSGAGACVEQTDFCIGLFMPVCGCDGNTYGNGCEAHNAGTDVAFDGECPVPPGDCRSEGCAPSESCEPCRGVGGAVYVCLPPGTAC